jgi:PPM family protein phosphatase
MNVTNAIKVIRLSDVGLYRDHNEDAVASDLSIGLMVLADGMGGYKAGEVASEIAVLTLAAELTDALSKQKTAAKYERGLIAESRMLMHAVEKANAAIYQISQEQPQCAGMGTTLVVSLFTDNKFVVGHIGDSRAYRLRDGVLKQLTQDHSLLQEQINSGLITLEQAKTSSNKNLVTRALGIDPDAELELKEYDVLVGDVYMLCSDGLSDMVEDEELQQILIDAHGNIEIAANKLIQAANNNGGKDNISVVIALVKKEFAADKGWVKSLLGKVKN